MVIIVVREVESAVVIVVIHILIYHNHRVPSVEEGVSDDGSKRRAADDEVTIDVAAIDAVVEVVGSAVVVNGSDVVRNMHVSVIVVVVGVYVGGVRHSVSRVRAMAFGMTSRIASGSGLIAIVYITAAFCAGTAHRLGLCLAL